MGAADGSALVVDARLFAAVATGCVVGTISTSDSSALEFEPELDSESLESSSPTSSPAAETTFTTVLPCTRNFAVVAGVCSEIPPEDDSESDDEDEEEEEETFLRLRFLLRFLAVGFAAEPGAMVGC